VLSSVQLLALRFQAAQLLFARHWDSQALGGLPAGSAKPFSTTPCRMVPVTQFVPSILRICS
jgi:hypothetical protein